MCDREFISECLDFQGWKVKEKWFSGQDLYLRLVPSEPGVSCCGICGAVVTHGKGCMRERSVRHLSQWHRKTYVVFSQRRFFCKRCGKVVSEHIAWVRPYCRNTVMFEQLCASLCDTFAVTQVALQMKVDKMTLYNIDDAWIEVRNDEHRVSFDGVRYVGIDEVMIHRDEVKVRMKIPVPVKDWGTNRKERRCKRIRKLMNRWCWVVRPCFATIIYDLETGRILAIGEGRSCKVASSLLRSLGKDVLRKVEAVCMDMAACYRKAVEKVLPKAAIVFDRFHVKGYVNEAVEDVRKAAQAKADEKERKFIFNQRWLLLKSGPEERDKWRLDHLFEINKDLALAYQLKDQFDTIFTLANREEAEKELDTYISYCRRSRLEPFKKLAGRLSRWKPYMLNYFDNPITNGMVEGMNNVVKRVLYRGFGYRNMSYFFGKVRVATGDLPTMVELGVTIAENKYQEAS